MAVMTNHHVILAGSRRDPSLQDVPGLLTVVDGTFLSALPTMMEASLRKGKTGSASMRWAGLGWAGERREAAGPECETSATTSGLVTSRRASQASCGSRRQAEANANDRLKPVGSGSARAAGAMNGPAALQLEAAGIEPASRNVSAQTSTCVSGQFGSRGSAPGRQGASSTSPKLF
jgi:hypothetical protein